MCERTHVKEILCECTYAKEILYVFDASIFAVMKGATLKNIAVSGGLNFETVSEMHMMQKLA